MIDKLPVEKGAEDIISKLRSAREARKAVTASETSPDVSPAPSAAEKTDQAAGAEKPKPRFFPDVNVERKTFFADVKTTGYVPSRDEDKLKSGMKPKPAEVVPSVAPEPKSENESAPDQQPYVFHQGDEFAATSRDWKEKGNFTKISDKEKWMKISEEDLDLNTQLAEMKKEVDEFSKNYSKVAGEAGAKQGTIKKILNPLFNPEDYDEVKQSLGKWQQKRDEFERAFYHDLALKLSRGEINDQFEKQQEHNFDALMAKEGIELHSRKYDFKKDYSAGKNWISPKIADGYNNFIGKFRKMHPALRIGAGAGIFVVGNIPATIAWRIIGGLAAGKGAQEGLQAAAELWRQRKERKSLQEFEKDMDRRNISAQERINERLGRLERQNQGMERRMAKYVTGDYYRKFAGVVIAGLIGSGTMARLIQSTGMGGAIREKIFGGGAAATQAHEAMVAKPSVGSLPSPEPTKFSSETFEQMQKGFEDANPDKHIDDVAKNLSKTFAGGIEPDVKAGGSLQNWAETTHETGAKVQVSEISKPKFEDIASGKVGQGGSIEKISDNVLRAIKKDPEYYGLDPNDADFSAKADGLRKGMIEEFYKKKGFSSYKEFDSYVRRGPVQPGDRFDINYDPSEKKFHLLYDGKGMRPDVSPSGAGAADQEAVPSKPNVSVDDTKPKASVAAPDDTNRPRAGAVAEQQPTRARGGGRMKFSPEIEEMDRKAAASGAMALESQQHADSLKARAAYEVAETAKNNSILYVKTRGLANLIVNEAGVGNRANFWEHSMDNWKNLLNSEYQISQVERLNDATNKTNISLNKLRSLYPILEKYHRQGIESIGDCLKEAVKNTTDLLKINELVLRK